MSEFPHTDPYGHARHVREQLSALIRHLREEVREVEDPRAEALFETAAEVIGGLVRAFEHFEEGSEEAWRL